MGTCEKEDVNCGRMTMGRKGKKKLKTKSEGGKKRGGSECLIKMGHENTRIKFVKSIKENKVLSQ